MYFPVPMESLPSSIKSILPIDIEVRWMPPYIRNGIVMGDSYYLASGDTYSLINSSSIIYDDQIWQQSFASRKDATIYLKDKGYLDTKEYSFSCVFSKKHLISDELQEAFVLVQHLKSPKIADSYGNQQICKDNVIVYHLGAFGQYSEKRGQLFCHKECATIDLFAGKMSITSSAKIPIGLTRKKHKILEWEIEEITAHLYYDYSLSPQGEVFGDD